jgi:predicted ArsR family transcriptional regulator
VKRITSLYRPHITAKTLAGRLEQLANLRSKDGYMATWQPSEADEYIFTERNCPIEHVAETCDQACHSDLSLFIDLLDADVIRLNHRKQGDHFCSYEVRARAKATSPERPTV